MSLVILNGSLSLNKIIEAAKGIPPHSNGDTYIPVSIFINEENHAVTKQQVSIQLGKSKEDREAKTETVYLGGGFVGLAGEVVKDESDKRPF